LIELFILTTVTLVVLAMVRPGKTPPLDNPLIIERPGKYHMTLAPQLNLAQTFIEEIAKQLTPCTAEQDSTTLCFEVRDKEMTAHGQDFYLLAATQRNSMLYFQAIASQTSDPKICTAALLKFADAVLVNIPRTASIDPALNEKIISTIKNAAQPRGISILNLPNHSA
jgi:hypothetical protein